MVLYGRVPEMPTNTSSGWRWRDYFVKLAWSIVRSLTDLLFQGLAAAATARREEWRRGMARRRASWATRRGHISGIT